MGAVWQHPLSALSHGGDRPNPENARKSVITALPLRRSRGRSVDWLRRLAAAIALAIEGRTTQSAIAAPGNRGRVEGDRELHGGGRSLSADRVLPTESWRSSLADRTRSRTLPTEAGARYGDRAPQGKSSEFPYEFRNLTLQRFEPVSRVAGRGPTGAARTRRTYYRDGNSRDPSTASRNRATLSP